MSRTEGRRRDSPPTDPLEREDDVRPARDGRLDEEGVTGTDEADDLLDLLSFVGGASMASLGGGANNDRLELLRGVVATEDDLRERKAPLT